MGRAGKLADRVIDMRAERLPAGIAIEKRRENMQRQRRGKKERILSERLENQFAQFPPGRTPFGDLPIVFGLDRLMSGGDAAVDPLGFIENLPRLDDLVGGEGVRNANGPE